jgi:diaminohydroxyphosphoribosylaminopyrimidine deaminase/5-amino-6-(5-phosphoribosylamino)uracil reductase
VGLCERQAADLNRPYLTWITRKRPYVILKWAQSLDGKIATRTGESRWISSPASRDLVHKLRARVDAIVVGIGTVLADDPLLTARNVAVRRVATRVVLDTRLRLPEHCRLVRTAKAVPTIVLTSKAAAAGESRVARLERRGVEVVPCTVRSSAIDLTTAMRILARRQFTNVLVEGGGKVLSAFLDSRLADEALVLVSPKLIGGTSAPMAYGGAGRMRISDTNCSVVEIRRSGEDQLYHIVL